MGQEQPTWDLVADARASVGEIPIWVPEQESLYWIDIFEPSLNRTSIQMGDTQRWKMPDIIGSYGLSEGLASAVVALSSGIYRLDLRSGNLMKMRDAPYDETNYRFNDGRCDPSGRFWVGTMRLEGSQEPIGGASFWRLDGGGFSREIDGLTIANGIAFSPDSSTMYLADRPGWQVLAFDYDPESGIASNRRTFARVPEGHYPDGAAVDSDGGYWIALFGAGRIVRFLPNGTLDRDLRAPVTHPTMVSFGGPDLRTLFVTSAREFVEGEDLDREPLAGAIFSSDVGIQGLPEPRISLGI